MSHPIKTPSSGDTAAKLSAINSTDDQTIPFPEGQRLRNAQWYNHVLEMILNGLPLTTILNTIIRLIEDGQPGMRASVLLLSDDGKRLLSGAAPRLPETYNNALHGVAIGPAVGSCGTAAYRNERVIVSDIFNDPLWQPYQELARLASVAACWSEPIRDIAGKVLGTFAMYYDEPREPTDKDILLITEAAQLASVAIERFNALHYQQLTGAILEQLPHALVVADGDMKVLHVNSAFSQITGFSADDVIGQHSDKLLPNGAALSDYLSKVDRMAQPDSWIGELDTQQKDGTPYSLELRLSLLRDEQGNIDRIIGLFSDITERKRQERIIQHQANYDRLTDLPNRLLLTERLRWTIEQCKRESMPFALILLDLDFFKEINDSLGHDRADALLIEVGARLRTNCRQSDTIARLGGDEFALLLTGFNEHHELELFCDKLQSRLNEPYHLYDEQQRFISASFGIATFPADGEDAEQLFKSADQAMYNAKRQGRNRYCFFNDSLRQQAESSASLRRDLKLALENQQLELAYQPIYDLDTARIAKAEVLVRWHHPQRGNISPGQFIPVAEKGGLIRELGQQVRLKALTQLREWSRNEKPLALTINISTAEFWHQRLDQEILELISALQVPKDMITVEITESVLLNNKDGVHQILQNLRDGGVKIAIDDFGTGYSALSYLANFPIDILKIDRSFINEMEADSKKQALVETIINLAHNLGLSVVAEGIETEQQWQMLKLLGCNYGQGFWMSRPLNLQDFESLLSQSPGL